MTSRCIHHFYQRYFCYLGYFDAIR